MHRDKIRRLLAAYRTSDQEDQRHLAETQQFVERYPDCFERELLVGHVTGSAWIVSPDRSQALLTHHRKLEMWVQLGGHADGNPDIFTVSLREGIEESGLTQLKPLSKNIFDLHIHRIPANNDTPAHYHYDIRFIFEADPEEALVVSAESKALAWVPLDRIDDFQVDASVLRMVRKTQQGQIPD
jgi:hypothetical protein